MFNWLSKSKSRIAKLEKQLAAHQQALSIARDTLIELQLGHAHNRSNPDYRPLGDNYGYCSQCGVKVGLDEDIAKEALDLIESTLKE